MARKRKRRRATAVVVDKRGRILLVLHRGEKYYSLPGGGIDGSESSLEAAIREVREETQLRAISARRLFRSDCEGGVSAHKVSEVRVGDGKVKLQGKEIKAYKWWDGKPGTKVNGHVHAITKSSGVFSRN